MQYIPQTLVAAAPWTALLVLALVVAIARLRDDRRLRAILVWAAAVMVPLCFGGQKQYHYLFPAIPALAILTGWLVQRMLERDLPHWELARTLALGTFIVLLAGALALPCVGRQFRGRFVTVDWISMGSCIAGIGLALALARRSLRSAMIAFAIAAAVTMTVLTQAWMPTLLRGDARMVAAGVRAIGPGPYYFYGENVSLPLIFYLQQRIERLRTPEELCDAIRQHPDLIVIALTKSGVSSPPLSDQLERAAEIRKEDQTFDVYRVRPAPGT